MITNIGEHKVQNGDIMEGIDNLMEGKKAEIFYSDPPWGLGNLRYWQTINKRMNNTEPKEVNYTNFIKQIFTLGARYAENIMFVEYGIKWRNDIIDCGKAEGFNHIGIANLKYKSGSKLLPMDLHIFAKKQIGIPPNYSKIQITN